MRQLGLDAETVFTHPDIRAWRSLPDRQNCTLDAEIDGRPVRLHIKRYAATHKSKQPAEIEADGHQLLINCGIPTCNLVAWGVSPTRQSFVIFEDLKGYQPADKFIAGGGSFAQVSQAIADLAAKLHQSTLHHRDMYLCHFMIETGTENPKVCLIDPARVRRMPHFLTRGRWIVKDVAQFWYSTLQLPISDTDRSNWLRRYCLQRQLPSYVLLEQDVLGKVRRIARHDAKLKKLRPARNVSIPW